MLWNNSHLSDIFSSLPPPKESGWVHNPDNTYSVDWEDPEIEGQIKQNIDFLLSGCGCKTGCRNARCSCKRKALHCGPGCVCIGCNNLPAQGSLAENDAIEEDEDQDTTSDIASESGCETNSDIETEIVTDFSHFMIHVDDDN